MLLSAHVASTTAALMAGVGADRRVAGVDGGDGLVVDALDESAAAAHHELAVPLVGQQQRESDLAADHAVDPAVATRIRAAGERRRRLRRRRVRGDRDGFGDLDVGKLQLERSALRRRAAGRPTVACPRTTTRAAALTSLLLRGGGGRGRGCRR